MTTKQIAEATGRTERSVQGWAKRTGEKIASVGEKIASVANTGRPADYDLEEALAIIETGMGRNAADIYRTNAENAGPWRKDVRLSTDSTPEVSGIIRETVASTIRELVPALLAAFRGAEPAKPAPTALPPPADLWPRDALRKIVDGWARSHGRDFHGAWAGLYREYGYRYHRDIVRAAKNRGQTVLDYADAENILGELLALAYFLYDQKEPSQCAV